MSKKKRLSQRLGVSGQYPPFPRRAGLWMALGLTALSPGATGAAFPANINLSALDGTNGFRLSGVAAFDQSGRAVSTAGDVNGDGVDDLLIGAPDAPNGYSSGASYVVFGGAGAGSSGNLELSTLDGTSGFKLSGAAAYDRSGFAVSPAGDVNGDGVDDLLIGAPYAGPNGERSGASYVVFGGARVGSTGDLNLSALDGTNGFRLSGAGALDESGRAVNMAGDVNGDGVDDLLIGAPGASRNGVYGYSSGASYVVFGGAGVGSSGNLELSALDGTNGFRLSDAVYSDFSGRAVSTAGDVNGDGVDDLLIGAPGAPSGDAYGPGASYVVFGRAELGSSGNLELSALDGTNGFKLSGVANDHSGSVVSTAGDVNGDGVDDLLIGAPRAYANGYVVGASYVVFGGAGVGSGGHLELSTLDGTNGFKLSGAAHDTSGDAVSTAGDVNGDGVDDLLIGAPFADPNGDFSGASYVVFGGAEVGSSGHLELSTLDGTNGFKLSGVAAGDVSGFAVSTAGDVNGDGVDDVLIGAPFAGPNGEFSGAGYVVFGQAPPPPPPPPTCNGLPATIVGTFGNDTLVGTPGNDVIQGRGGNDIIRGLGGRDVICGGAGDDRLFGNQGKDQLFGDGGNDVLKGGTDNDRLFGQSGDDAMDGGLGSDDNCNGGSGTDRATSCEQPRGVP